MVEEEDDEELEEDEEDEDEDKEDEEDDDEESAAAFDSFFESETTEATCVTLKPHMEYSVHASAVNWRPGVRATKPKIEIQMRKRSISAPDARIQRENWVAMRLKYLSPPCWLAVARFIFWMTRIAPITMYRPGTMTVKKRTMIDEK